ncbi:hypothetical protein [Hubei rhabdo-like virus 7]|uniref:Uncharacterized protein n=1 Tax=Hubei rhabdo-like virus 7 TaxID=1923191 RepID=A0A1L3KMX2_9MONO|nr:hypothetical protein [Hubei rhabdo-like virus 7]APG78727.1 hypothetical protein [Hubei rhabdo-like virus 7]
MSEQRQKILFDKLKAYVGSASPESTVYASYPGFLLRYTLEEKKFLSFLLNCWQGEEELATLLANGELFLLREWRTELLDALKGKFGVLPVKTIKTPELSPKVYSTIDELFSLYEREEEDDDEDQILNISDFLKFLGREKVEDILDIPEDLSEQNVHSFAREVFEKLCDDFFPESRKYETGIYTSVSTAIDKYFETNKTEFEPSQIKTDLSTEINSLARKIDIMVDQLNILSQRGEHITTEKLPIIVPKKEKEREKEEAKIVPHSSNPTPSTSASIGPLDLTKIEFF